MDKLHTHYDNLKVTRNAPVEVIRAAYRAMAQKYHPDINQSPAANNIMSLLNEAWDVLSDPVKRAEHDRWILSEEEKRKRQPPVNATHSSGPVFKYKDFDFHVQTPPKRKATPKNNFKPKEHSEKPVEKKESLSIFESYNAWLGRKDVQLKAAAIAATVFCVGLGWLQYEHLRSKKLLEELRAVVAAPASEDAPDRQVTAEKPLKFIPLPDAEAIFQSEVKKKIDPEQQEKSGYVKGDYQQKSTGLSTFTVDNQMGGDDAIARIYRNGIKPASRSMYVKAGEKFTARGLSPGSYVFRYRFIGSTKIHEADRTFSLKEINTADGTSYSNVTVTLFTVNDGNMRTTEVSDEKF
jgi:hypothetical protein